MKELENFPDAKLSLSLSAARERYSLNCEPEHEHGEKSKRRAFKLVPSDLDSVRGQFRGPPMASALWGCRKEAAVLSLGFLV